MLSHVELDTALALLAGVPVETAAERVPLARSLGRVLAEDCFARLSVPPFDKSPFDGYAYRTADVPGTLRVIGTAAAGCHELPEPEPGEALRIFTGAPVPHSAEAAAQAQAEALLEEKLAGGKSVILTDSFAAKAFLEEVFPDKKDSFLFYDSSLAVFGKAGENFDKRFAFGAVGGDAAECEKTACVDLAVNPRELARIMIRTGAEPNPGRTADFESLDLPKASGKYAKLLDKAAWNMDREPEAFELDGLKCALCHNLGQARRLLQGTEAFHVIRVIA